MQKKIELFNDGIINVLDVDDGVIKETLYKNIHFGNRTYGVKRFFKAKDSGSVLERLISVPDNFMISRDNLIELKEFRTGETKLYEIVMYQPKYDTMPQSIYLTLRKPSIEYSRI